MSAGTGRGAASAVTRARSAASAAPDEPLAPGDPQERGLDVGAPAGPWPHGVSREPTMRISDVLADLGSEFPAVTPSKLRFLEEQGLVEPRRTPGGYRQYSPADVERLRYVLRQQRDRYLPLRVIGEQLAALDAGTVDERPAPRLVTRDGQRALDASVVRLSADALAHDVGVDPALVTDLVAAGVLRPDVSGHLGGWARPVVVAAAALAEHGVEPRHLRAFRSAADRQVSLVDQIVAPLREQRRASGREQAANVAAEVGELCASLHSALLRAGVADLTG